MYSRDKGKGTLELMSKIKLLLRRTFVYDIVDRVRDRKEKPQIRAQQEAEIREWEAKGKPLPPPHVLKQRTLEHYAKAFSLQILIETGTYQGDMVEAMKDAFNKIYSIELKRELYERATKRFDRNDHISIIHGDSGKVLREVLAKINEPCLFWLDGHYSAGITAKGELDTPINEELNHILNHPVEGHVILIDDARLFVGENHYPRIDELKDIILKRHSDWILEDEHDIIRIHKKPTEMEVG
jgi:hypothetical protein